MTLVVSANKICSDTEFILRERSFIHIINNRGPRIDPWRTPRFNVSQSEKIFSAVLGGFTSTLSSVNQKVPEPIFRYSSNFKEM